MRAKWLATFIVFGFGLTLSGCKSKEQADAEKAAKQGEQDKLQGKWKIVSRQADEDEESNDPVEPIFYYVIDGDMMKQVMRNNTGGEDVLEYQKIVLMPDKDTKQIDLTLSDEKVRRSKPRAPRRV